MSIVEFRLHQNSNIKIKVATQIGERPFFRVSVLGVTPHIYSISRSLLIMFLITGAKVLHFSYTTKNHLAELWEIPLTFLP